MASETVTSSKNDNVAASAEAGKFPDAVKWQTKAIALADEGDRQKMTARLDLYKSGKPFREELRK